MMSICGLCSVVAYSLILAGKDLAELSLIFLDIVGQGEHELLGVLGAHDDAAHHRSLGHAGSGEDEVHEKLVGTVADHREVAVFAVGDLGTELDLKLVLVLIFWICHFMIFYLLLMIVNARH